MNTKKYREILKASLLAALILHSDIAGAGGGLLGKTEELRVAAEEFARGTKRLALLMGEKDRIATETLKNVSSIVDEQLQKSSCLSRLMHSVGISSSPIQKLVNSFIETTEHLDEAGIKQLGRQNVDLQAAVEILAVNAISRFAKKQQLPVGGDLQLIDTLSNTIRKLL
jgi:hypothetical protein